MSFDNTVVVTVAGYSKQGWTSVRLMRGIEQVPSLMTLEVTEEYPNRSGLIPFAPGMACSVTIGGDVAITGYIDRYTAGYTAGNHTISITVRSKMQDSVDADAEFSQFSQGVSQVNWVNLADLAGQLLVKPYGIKVVDKAKDTTVVPAFNINLGEQSFEIISRVAHTMAVLVYDDPDGNCVLAKVGQEGAHSSGFTEGQGIQECTANFSMDTRFSEYFTVYQAVDTIRNLTPVDTNLYGYAKDQDVPRNRKKFVVNQVPNGTAVSAETWGNNVALWLKNRNWGRAHAVEIVYDSWRDSAGRLWCPNAFALVNAPSVHIIAENWIIASVSYQLNSESGTTASLVLMPQEAFSIEPSVLFRLPLNLTPTTPGGAATPVQGVPPS